MARRDEADEVGEFLERVERQGASDVSADAGLDSSSSTSVGGESLGLQRQKKLHDEAFQLIAKGLDLETQVKDPSSRQNCVNFYDMGLAKFNEAFNIVFQADEIARSQFLAQKMHRNQLMVEERLRMLKRQSAVGVTPGRGSVNLHSSISRPDDDPTVNYFLPQDASRWIRSSTPLMTLLQGEFDLLGRTFGFQAGNVANQREHLTMLLINTMMRPSRYPGQSNSEATSPPRRDTAAAGASSTSVSMSTITVLTWNEAVKHIHKELLSNYISWCKFLVIPANSFLTGKAVSDTAWQNDPARADSGRVRDVALYLLVWGEAANLRHCPECLCFLFHQMIRKAHELSPGPAAMSAQANASQYCFLEDSVNPLVLTIGKVRTYTD